MFMLALLNYLRHELKGSILLIREKCEPLY